MSIMQTYEIKNNIRNIKIDKLSYEYFIKTITFLHEKDINIIYVNYPVSNYSYYTINQTNILEHKKLISSAILNKSKTPIILDYEKLFFNNYTYFKDGVHSNGIGAKIFTEKLKKDLKKIKEN